MAVYTEVSADDLEAFLAAYDLGEVTSFKGIAEGVENSNYLLRTVRGDFILTLYEKRVRADDLPYFLGLMDYLAEKGVRCPTPVHGKDGAALRSLCGRPAAIVTFLDGVSVLRPTPEQCRAVGRALAELHLAARGYARRRDNDLSVAGWRRLMAACGAGADRLGQGLGREIEAELDQLARAWPKDLPESVIHADLFPDNVFFLGAALTGVIDFYFACNDFCAYDLAVSLNAWCFEADGAFNVTKAGQMMAGYDEIRALTLEERAAFPLLARGAAMRFFLTRLYDWLNQVDGALVKVKDPREYLRRQRFHRNFSDLNAYGLNS